MSSKNKNYEEEKVENVVHVPAPTGEFPPDPPKPPLGGTDPSTPETLPVEPKPKLVPITAGVGTLVHFYTKNTALQYHGDEGPYAALVTRVHEDGGGDVIVFPAVNAFIAPFEVYGISEDKEEASWVQGVGTAAKKK